MVSWRKTFFKDKRGRFHLTWQAFTQLKTPHKSFSLTLLYIIVCIVYIHTSLPLLLLPSMSMILQLYKLHKQRERGKAANVILRRTCTQCSDLNSFVLLLLVTTHWLFWLVFHMDAPIVWNRFPQRLHKRSSMQKFNVRLRLLHIPFKGTQSTSLIYDAKERPFEVHIALYLHN